jgi:hypothetical protein
MDGLSSSSREPIASPRLPEGRMLKRRAKNAALVRDNRVLATIAVSATKLRSANH